MLKVTDMLIPWFSICIFLVCVCVCVLYGVIPSSINPYIFICLKLDEYARLHIFEVLPFGSLMCFINTDGYGFLSVIVVQYIITCPFVNLSLHKLLKLTVAISN